MNRTLNIVFFVICFLLTASRVLALLTGSAPKSNQQDAAQTATYILLALFAALTLVFGYRAFKRA